MVGGCSMVNVLFLELFVSVVQILIDSLVRDVFGDLSS